MPRFASDTVDASVTGDASDTGDASKATTMVAAALAIAFIVVAIFVLAAALGAAAPLGKRDAFTHVQPVCAGSHCEDLFRTDVYTGTEPYGVSGVVPWAESAYT